MIQRPKPGETEDDILRMQEEFFREKNNKNLQPSAQVVNLRRTEHLTTKRTNANNESLTRKPSKYALSKDLTNNPGKRSKVEGNTSSVIGDIVEKNYESVDVSTEVEDDKVYFPKIKSSVLGKIVEKNIDKFIDFDKDIMPSEGFPVITILDSNILPGKKSLHASHLEQLNKKTEERMDVDEPNVSDTKDFYKPSLNLTDKSYIISSNEADTIHKENVNILDKMSEKEILEEQKNLMSTLDPKLLEFMKKMRLKSSSSIVPTPAVTNDAKSMDVSASSNGDPVKIKEQEESSNEDSLWENDVLSNPNINKWLHFDSFEKDKMEWMKAIAQSKKIKPNDSYEARFDFKGYLLPYIMDYTEETKTLFHHGEEPHRPGYSITELFDLCRSTVTQQRVMALNTLAGILEYYNSGTYKDILELPITKIFFIIRIAIDENKTIILEPALKGMRNLVYNRIDEACLDALLGFQEGTYQPCLENDKSEIEELDSKENELKDFHLAEIDLIAALIRTDILQRLYYIMDTIKPSFNCVQYCLQILTRLSRDSIETSSKIVAMEHLMLTIINNFLPVASVNFVFDANIVYNGKPILAALKFLRVLSLQNKDIGNLLVTKYDILKPLSAYISSEVNGTYGLHIQIEAFSILSNLLHYEIGVENALSVFPIILTTLYKHVQHTNIFYNSSVISVTHAAVVLQFVNRLLQCNYNLESQKFQIYPLLKEGIQKWLTQAAIIDQITCGHLRLVCALLDCCATISIKERQTLRFLNVLLEKLVQSQGFKEIMKHLVLSSNLLSGIEPKDFFVTKNLVNLGSIVVDKTQKELPILNVMSPIPFLASLFKILTIINEVHISKSYIEHVETYLKKLAVKTPSLSENWFTRMETDFVFSIVKIAVQCDIEESQRDLLYKVANKLCYILRADKKYELEFLFQQIIFNKQWFTAERLFNLVSLSERHGFSKVLSNMEDIRMCYTNIIKLNYTSCEPNIVLRIWKAPILPRDWIYLPILALYQSKEAKTTPDVKGEHANRIALQATKKRELIIGCTLEWILFNEICFPDLINDIDITDRFCRIMCVYLCDSSLFLEPFIKLLLRKCTEVLFKKSHRFNFDKELTGLNNFQDFYMQFLEQFEAVSYGDPCFAACVLVPLAQRHNVKWRKMLWSEYAGCLRALDCPDDYLCYELKDYLCPEENDESLIKCYYRALNSRLVRPGTIVYKIAEHHFNNYKNKITINKNPRPQ